jgi:hypothetical protein
VRIWVWIVVAVWSLAMLNSGCSNNANQPGVNQTTYKEGDTPPKRDPEKHKKLQPPDK